MLQNMKFSL